MRQDSRAGSVACSMKATIHISLEIGDHNVVDRIIQVDNPDVLERILQACLDSAVVIDSVAKAGPSDPEILPPVADERAAMRREAAQRGAETRAKNKAEKEVEAGSAPPIAETPKVTIAAVEKAIRAAVEAKGIDAIRSVYSGFTGKDGEPCVKLSEIKESDYAAVIEELA